MIYFTSDLHLGHDSECIYSLRGFNSTTEHDAAIVRNWNEMIRDDDVVYVLGDITFGSEENDSIRRLNGEIHFIIGNHDSARKICQYEAAGWINEGYAVMLEIDGEKFYLSHYPSDVMNFGRRESICLCGHKHSKDPLVDAAMGAYHVELEAHNNRPVSIDDVIKDMHMSE